MSRCGATSPAVDELFTHGLQSGGGMSRCGATSPAVNELFTHGLQSGGGMSRCGPTSPAVNELFTHGLQSGGGTSLRCKDSEPADSNPFIVHGLQSGGGSSFSFGEAVASATEIVRRLIVLMVVSFSAGNSSGLKYNATRYALAGGRMLFLEDVSPPSCDLFRACGFVISGR